MSSRDGPNTDGEGEVEIGVALREPAWLTRWTVTLLPKAGNAGEFPAQLPF